MTCVELQIALQFRNIRDSFAFNCGPKHGEKSFLTVFPLSMFFKHDVKFYP